MLDELNKQIETKRKELLSLKEKKKELQENPIFRLAAFLHLKLCNLNHIDGCSWEYEHDWTRGAHKEYLEQAQMLVYHTKLDLETIIKVIAHI